MPIPFPGQDCDEHERALVALQIGRDPRGEIAVAARCSYGLPAVVRTSPRLRDGSPFPTLYYLTCPVAVRLIGGLEASGRMVQLEAQLAEDERLRSAYQDADERYRAQRDSIARLDDPVTAGGMPSRVKCMHALYAHELGDGNPIGAIVRSEVEPFPCPGPCVTEQDGTQRRVPGHPGFKGKKRRRS